MKVRHALVSVALLGLGILGWAVGQYIGRTPVAAQQGQRPATAPREPGTMMLPATGDSSVHLTIPAVGSGAARTPAVPPVASDAPSGKLPAPRTPEIVGEVTDVSGGGTEESSADNASGKMEPCVTLQWIGPQSAKIGQAAAWQIVVKNVSSSPVHQVVVRNRLPAGVTLTSAEPKPIGDAGLQMWELGTMQPRQERRIEMQLLPESRGDLRCEATVAFAANCSTRISVREPKLAVKVSAPAQAIVGDPVAVSLVVRNPGDGMTERVKLRAILPDGLENTRGKTIDFDVGNLAPNESRNMQLPCTAQGGGSKRIEVVATAAGNLSAQDVAAVEVIVPSLDVAVIGRDMLYLDRKTTFTVKVTNTSVAPASNVTVSDVLPPGLKFVSATDQGQHDGSLRMVSWYLGDLAGGESKEVKVDLQAIETGEHLQRASVTAARGATAEGQLGTRVEGVSALVMEVRDLDNPVEVNADTGYEVRIVNMGTKMETQLVIACTLPEKMELRDAVCSAGLKYTVNGRDIIFETIPKLAPRADISFRINVRGTAPGDYRFRATLKADGLTNPVVREETTKVY